MSNKIEFKLFAPNNKAAVLKGSFSDWEEIPMKKGEDGYFRTQVELEDGVYQYKFRVQSKSPSFKPDEWVDVTDPYATRVIDDSTQNGVLRIKDGEPIIDTYVWQHDNKPLPQNHELVMYEMHVSDFTGGEDDPHKRGFFKHAIEKLDYLCELGINAIELMPLNEYPGNYRWGYKVCYYFAAESSYGPSEDLKRLIECHARGIRVILDGIYNHTDEESPLLLIDRDYWYYHHMHYPDDPANYWGPEFNYENYDEKLGIKQAWEFIGDVVRFWIQEYHIDGIRFDAVRQLANYDFLHWNARKAINATAPKPFYNIAEYIPETTDIVAPKGLLEGSWHESFRIFVVEAICEDKFDVARLKDALDAKRQGFPGVTSVVNYLASHDREHILVELGDRGIFGEDAFRRAKLGAVLQMTAMGVPQIWMGDEFGADNRKAKIVTQPNKLPWTLLKNEHNRDLLEYYKKLIKLRKETPALHTSNIEFLHENLNSKVLAYVRWNDEGSRVVVVANFSGEYLAEYQIPNFPAAGKWHEWTGNYDVEAGEGNLTLDLPEYEAKVLVT